MRLKLKHHPEIKPRFRLPLHVYMIYLLICTFLLTGVSFARYIATGSGSDSARIAAGTVEVSHDSNTKIEITRPTDDAPVTKGFSFTVSNKNSEVAIRYDVIVTLNEPLPEGVSMTVDGKPCPALAQFSPFQMPASLAPAATRSKHIQYPLPATT